MFDDRGLPLSSRNAAAVDAYNRSVEGFLAFQTSAMPLAREAASADPEFCMAACLRGYFFMTFATFNVVDKARAALAAALALTGNATERERRHVLALQYWVEGDLIAANSCWEAITIDYPLDLLALRLHHFNSFWMGQTRALRSVPAAVLGGWSDAMPGYGNVLGMLAFGLEENGEYALAERYGRKAVELNANDLWAHHAVAHVLEMQDRHAEGLNWLSQPINAWDDRNPFRGHLWWHRALFLLDNGQGDAALALYDDAVAGEGSDFYLDIQNAASLLARLEFYGVDVGTRWKGLADHAEAHVDDHALVFTDLHCVMSLARERRFDQAEKLVDSMRAYAAAHPFYTGNVIDRLGIRLCETIIAFEQNRYYDAISLFMPVRHQTAPAGASHAQRDILEQYLLEAAIRSGRPHLAQAILNERSFFRPSNATNLRKQAQLDAMKSAKGALEHGGTGM